VVSMYGYSSEKKKLIKLRKQKKINRKYQTEKKYQLEN
jgi:hypothetical protein